MDTAVLVATIVIWLLPPAIVAFDAARLPADALERAGTKPSRWTIALVLHVSCCGVVGVVSTVRWFLVVRPVVAAERDGSDRPNLVARRRLATVLAAAILALWAAFAATIFFAASDDVVRGRRDGLVEWYADRPGADVVCLRATIAAFDDDEIDDLWAVARLRVIDDDAIALLERMQLLQERVGRCLDAE